MTLEERLWSKVVKSDEDCWLWTGRTRTPSGYGRIWDGESRHNPKLILAHRLVWTLTFGPIPDGMEVCHSCDTPACVRPDHLFLGSHATNMADMTAKQRQARGPQNARTRLNETLVSEIRGRSEAGVSERVIAAEFGVSRGAITSILRRKSWDYV